MTYEFKRIAPESIPAALAKAEKYRDLNQPEQAESIARDVLVVSPEHKGALRELGLSITDQFAQHPEWFRDAEEIFRRIADPYETPYLIGLAHERLCRALLRTSTAAETLAGLWAGAMRHYAAAERVRPAGNDDAILRWNSLVRLLERHPQLDPQHHQAEHVDYGDSPPVR